ncbi:hypothetical protein ACFWGN_09885 [Oerskovia sp. NPDC060338]|uniref:hypothetical protein n=1 Tax=Oerskovia sp. NPDC060338 TaxID=3347100 RepID=UPI00365A7DD7
MTISGADLITYANAADVDLEYADGCAEAAMALVDNFISIGSVPESVLRRSYLVVAAEMFEQRNAPSGIRQFAGEGYDGGGMRVARDPMTGAYPILRPFLAGGFA